MATSSMLLPVAILMCLLLWLVSGVEEVSHLLGIVGTIVCMLLMVELNNSNVLLRVRSRMVSATFVLVWSSCIFLHTLQWAYVAALGIILAYHSLFRTYQQSQTTGDAFNIFLCIGVVSLYLPQALLLAVPFWLALHWFQALHIRGVFASLLGLIVPYWLGYGYAFYEGMVNELFSAWQERWIWSFPSYGLLEAYQIEIAAWLLLLDVFSIVHLLQYSYQDKIRTRVLFYFLSWMTVVYVLMMMAFPVHFNSLLSMFIVNSSPLIAHYFTLSSGKFTLVLFTLATISFLAIIVLNL